MKNFVQRGKVLDYVNGTGSKILSGAVVVCGVLLGVAATDIEVAAVGAVNLEGVFSLPKATGAISQGAKVYWDTANSNITTTASGNTAIGVAWESAVSGDATVRVVLTNAV